MVMRKVIVRLSQKDDFKHTLDLEYDIIDNPFTPRWIECYQRSQQRGDPISNPDRFGGLNNEWTKERVFSIINERVDQINQIVPGLIDRKLKDPQDQDTLNYLHSFFERYHGKVDVWLTDPWWQDKPRELRPIWSDLNIFIHKMESLNAGERPNIKITWYDTPKPDRLTRQDYALFTHQYRFGYIYSLYADVGKDLKSLTYDHDDHHLDFVPPTTIAADCQLQFFNTTEEESLKITRDCQNFYAKNRDYFQSKGYPQDDHRLVTGSIPLARLSQPTDPTALLNQIKSFNWVQNFYII